jgi:polyvinyl alcohol dehydrogenase (cytochrome)
LNNHDDTKTLRNAKIGLAGLALLLGALTGFSRSVQQPSKSSSANWPMFGRDIAGTHYNPDEKTLTPENISRLKPKWIFETGGDVSSQPIVVDGIVYFGSWDG